MRNLAWISVLVFAASVYAGPIRVVVWDEQQPAQLKAYPNFIGNHIADHLRSNPALAVKSVRLDDADLGLAQETLEHCDVLIWWGHMKHGAIKREKAQEIVDRIKAGKLALIALHSSHFSTPFMMVMEERAIEDALKTLPESERSRAKIEWTGDFIRKLPKWNAPLTPWFFVFHTLAGDGEVRTSVSTTSHFLT